MNNHPPTLNILHIVVMVFCVTTTCAKAYLEEFEPIY